MENKIFEYNIRTKADEVALWPFGDVHYGHVDCDYEKMNKYLKWAEENDAKIFLMGDMTETDVPAHMTNKGVMWQQDKVPRDQIEEMIELLEPLKKNIIAGIMGNHEQRIYNLTSLSVTEAICEKLGVKYIDPWPAYVKLNINKINYNVLIAHGAGKSQRAGYHLEKAIDMYPDSDLVMIGHIHYFASLPYHKVAIDEEGNEYIKTIVGVRTGGFLPYPGYARKGFMKPVATGSPIVFMGTKKNIISPNTSDFVGLS